MQQREKQKILSALQALNLVKVDDKNIQNEDDNDTFRSENDSINQDQSKKKRSIAPGLNVTVYNLKKKAETSQILDPNLVLDMERSRSVPSFDEALKNANSHNQKVPKELKLGIVANPLKI